jgi:4-amino-4-deoxy-L-arabinose transferase-like glycosyltransferase
MFRQIRRLFVEPNAHRASLLFIVLICVALRVYHLDAQSFWYDEGNSARIAERSLPLIIAGAGGDIHPPLYYIVLHYWRAIFGETEFALRMLSVACGVGLVFFTYLLARRLFNPRVGLIAAALMACSPFAVYYSQEARMYVLLAFEAVVSTWALTGIVDFGFRISDSHVADAQVGQSKIGNQKSKIAFYVLATAAGLYTQYAYPFVMIAQGVAVLIWLAGAQARRAQVRVIALYAAVNVAAIALFVPWLPIAIRQVTSWSVTPQNYQLGQAMLDAYRWLVVGRTLPLDQVAWPLLASGALALLGVLFGLLKRGEGTWLQRVWPTLLLFLLVVTPFTLLFVFHLYREAYLKFVLVCVAPMVILAAQGIDGVAAWVASVRGLPKHVAQDVVTIGLTAGLVGLWWPSLQNLYTNPAYARDDYRGIAQTVEAQAQPGDAVLLNAPNQWEVFTYYHRQGAPAIPLTYHPLNEAAVARQMQPIAGQYTRLFVLYYGEGESDPNSWFERWLAEHAFKADEQWVGNIRLDVYATQPPAATSPVSATFGDRLSLESIAVDLGPRTVGEIIPLRLTWRATAPLAQRYKVFVHLGPADAPPVAQNDGEPVGGFRPTSAWQVGERVVDSRGVWIKPGVPAGTYGLYLGVYDGASGERLPIQSQPGRVVGDRLWLGDVTIK